jgi:carboxymethylenebutenolidase
MGETVEFEANGGPARGYLAEPEGDKVPGLVVLQEWWGLDDHIRDVCDRFAGEGFLALAPDLFHGETTDQPDEAQQKMMALNMDEAEKEMRGAVNFLLSHERSNGQVGSIGFCLGGGLSVWAATANEKVGAVSTFYYVMPHGKPDFSKLEGKPVQGHFGTGDDFVSVEDAKALEAELNEAGAQAAFEFYEGAGHAFFNDKDRLGTYHEEHAQTAWKRTVDFFQRHLDGGDPEIDRVR